VFGWKTTASGARTFGLGRDYGGSRTAWRLAGSFDVRSPSDDGTVIGRGARSMREAPIRVVVAR
jgi:hypothetical protein